MTETETAPLPLTKAQQRVLKFIKRYHREHYYAPTIREICTEFGFASPNGAACHLHALRKKGYVTWVNNTSRTIRPTGASA